MKKTKIYLGLLTLVAAFGLSACGKNENAEKNVNSRIEKKKQLLKKRQT